MSVSLHVTFFKKKKKNKEKWNAKDKENYENGHEHLHKAFSGGQIEEASMFFRKLLEE